MGIQSRSRSLEVQCSGLQLRHASNIPRFSTGLERRNRVFCSFFGAFLPGFCPRRALSTRRLAGSRWIVFRIGPHPRLAAVDGGPRGRGERPVRQQLPPREPRRESILTKMRAEELQGRSRTRKRPPRSGLVQRRVVRRASKTSKAARCRWPVRTNTGLYPCTELIKA